MTEDTRATLTAALWFFATLALIALFISAGAQGELTPGHLVLAFTILLLAIAGTPFLLRMKSSETEQEKTKHRRVNTLLRDLTDEELVELKRRLSDAEASEESLAAVLGDDGEMVQRR